MSAPSPRALRMATPLLLLALLSAGGAPYGCGPGETYEPPYGQGPWILVDLYHTRLQNPEDFRLTEQEYNYQGTYGYARVFDHLEENGYSWRSIRELTLSPQRLEGFDVLFINLVHEERPDFTEDEIQAIDAFVRGGGGLFVIADHTNVYRHAERVNRFLEPMGIEVTYHTAVEPGQNSLSGLGWIAVEEFPAHPTNRGVELMGLQTGGPMRSLDPSRAQATALTSQASFGDLWDEQMTEGFYGNWTFDGDTTREPKGPMAVVMAAEHGAGRVVVVGDQNVYGDAFVHFGDNFRHAMNSFEWLAGQDQIASVALADIKPHGVNIGIDARLNRRALGNGGRQSYYTFFVNFNRDAEVTGRGITRFDGRDDALVLPSPQLELKPRDVDAIADYLRQGKKVVLTLELDLLGDVRYRPTIELLRQLAPELEVSAGGETISFSASAEQIARRLSAFKIERDEGAFALISPRLDVEGIALTSVSFQDVAPGESPVHGLLKMESSWGEPFLATQDGKTIARSKRLGQGELIVFLQDGFFRNRTTGESESDPPSPEALQATALQLALIDDLKRAPPPCESDCEALTLRGDARVIGLP